MSSEPAGQTGGLFLEFIAALNRRAAAGQAGSQIRRGESRSARCRKCEAGSIGCLAECEAGHIRSLGSALSMMLFEALCSIEDGTNENASDGILVVLVRRLGEISREAFELAIRRLYGENVGQCSNALDRATILIRFF
jgi:hypothetical protein